MIMPGTKLYIVTASDLIQVIQKQPKVLAFPPVAAKFASKICGASAEAHKILMTNVNGDDGDWGLFMESSAAIKRTLAPGQALDEMNHKMIKVVAASLDSLSPLSQEETTIKLGEWLFENVTAATTTSAYGPNNPFNDQAVAAGFWDFENDLMAFLAGLFPSLTARKGVAGRDRVAKAFEHYFRTGGHEESSSFVRERYEISVKNGLSIPDMARYELGSALAILVNTPPTIFWILYYIYSHEILDGIRKEIELIMTTTTSDSGELTYSLDVTDAKAHCPLLASTYQEVLRKVAIGTSIREVMQDTTLNEQWSLMRNALIQMPSGVIHRDASVWGNDVDNFSPRRFMKDHPQKTPSGKRPNPAVFRAFGGGTTLCPGRHFATTEILAVVTMFIMRYEMVPVAGTWPVLTTERTKQAAVILEPDHDVEVRILARKGYEDGRWAFSLKNAGIIFALATEDAA